MLTKPSMFPLVPACQVNSAEPEVSAKGPITTLTTHFLAISREPWPLGRPQQHQEFRGKQKNPLHEELVRIVRTF